MLLFWIAAAALSLTAAAMMVAGAARAARTVDEADPTLGLYRRQLGELDDLVERGLLNEAEHRSARAEAGRRILTSAERGAGAEVAGKPGRGSALAALLLFPLASVAVYLAIGAPGAPDRPFATRLAEWRAADPAGLSAAQIAAVLQAALADRPGDVEGLRFLAQAQLSAGSPFEAEANLRRAINLAPQRADLWVMLGRARTVLAEGVATPDAKAAYDEALRRDPAFPPARYYAGRWLIETGDVEPGLALWRGLLADLPPGADERMALEEELAAVESTGGLPAPDALAGESPEIQAAVRGMVDGLAARLAVQPDDPEGWVRLVRAYSVLGDTVGRDEALTAARARFGDRPDVLEALRQAALVP